MILELKPNIDKIKKYYDEKDAQLVLNLLSRIEEFNIPVYICNTRLWTDFVKDYPYTKEPDTIDYFYGLNTESLEKYINTKYGDDNPNVYVVEAHLLSMDHEKYWKFGTFVDLNGINTDDDFYSVDNWEELIDKAQIKNHWIAVSIEQCN